MTSEEYVSSSPDYPASKKTSPKPGYKVSVQRLNSWFFDKQALKSINLDVKENTATALIGPSGCGKTTLIRSLNRMNEMTLGARVEGSVFLDSTDIYGRGTD